MIVYSIPCRLYRLVNRCKSASYGSLLTIYLKTKISLIRYFPRSIKGKGSHYSVENMVKVTIVYDESRVVKQILSEKVEVC